ncbi:hypothetical protein M9H77_05353 [Catharanthus roseus]|uniref:Uncharacterized protein n=1 Tax=Catharanthus roseus TaxID=4058 RepID=A0ACC0CGQ7_CATRO|nr:hypothetical protein M9H77_05353 [Catharanthus roseus]
MSYDKEDTDNIENDVLEESHVLLIITTVQLKENEKDNNYAEWAKAMRNSREGELGTATVGASYRAQRTELSGNGREWTNAGGNGREWANAATTGLHGGSSGTSSINDGHASGDSSNGSNKFGNFPNLSHEQWSKLLTLLDNSNPAQTDVLSAMETLWILDSGCSHHMTGRKDFLKI